MLGTEDDAPDGRDCGERGVAVMTRAIGPGAAQVMRIVCGEFEGVPAHQTTGHTFDRGRRSEPFTG
jgi:hypothetical protein